MELACKNLYMFCCGKRCHARFITINIFSLYGQTVVLQGVGEKKLKRKDVC
ncbi:MAG: hypothetical protein PWQ17_302, partial [Anaerophaga sp.]|nr:hypothetical protein [Anaerophaga sp.]MDN5290050.1 hypothetical protein [Anaerophaga sp.]